MLFYDSDSDDSEDEVEEESSDSDSSDESDDISQVLADLDQTHPWNRLVEKRSDLHRREYEEDEITAEMNTGIYQHIQSDGYSRYSYCETLFPRIAKPPENQTKIPFIEIPGIDDAQRFRKDSAHLVQQIILDNPRREIQMSSLNRPTSSCLSPPVIDGIRPVLYQVVDKLNGSLVLECKDFMIIGPNRKDLQLIKLDSTATNILNGRNELDIRNISQKDHVYVYNIIATSEALMDHQGTLKKSRRPIKIRPISAKAIFYKASHYTFVTPHITSEIKFGVVLDRKVGRNRRIIKIFNSFEGLPGVFSSSRDINSDKLLIASIRRNISSSMRFSEPPKDKRAKDRLIKHIKKIFPYLTNENIEPMEVDIMDNNTIARIEDRLNRFTRYSLDVEASRLFLCRLFTLGCCAHNAYIQKEYEDKMDFCTATLVYDNPNDCVLPEEKTAKKWKSKKGWKNGNEVMMKIENHEEIDFFMRHNNGRLVFNNKKNSVNHRLPRFPRDGEEHIIYYKLVQPTTESLCRFFIDRSLGLMPSIRNTTFTRILDSVYGNRNQDQNVVNQVDMTIVPPQFTYKGHNYRLSEEQIRAVGLGCLNHQIIGIQAAYGTGKTIVGAFIAGLLAKKGFRILVMATTNHAVAQFTEAFRWISEFADIPIVRFIADSSAKNSSRTTDFDLSQVLAILKQEYQSSLTDEERDICTKYSNERRLCENLLNRAEFEDQFELNRSEKKMKRLLRKMVGIMNKHLRPNIVFMTTSSFINTTASGGLFENAFNDFDVFIGDEASHMSEPTLFAVGLILPKIRHIYIGDNHQLNPYSRTPEFTYPSKLATQGIMPILMKSRNVPITPLLITYRAHPELNELPSSLFYSNQLISGATANTRSFLHHTMSFPNPSVPFVFINNNMPILLSTDRIEKSLVNDYEASLCVQLVQRLIDGGVPKREISVITFYRGQEKILREDSERIGFNLATVDSSQGRENEVVIVLTTVSVENSTQFIEDERRMNVALSRSKQIHIVIGCVEGLFGSRWNRVIEWARSKNAIVQSDNMMEALFPPNNVYNL